MKQSKFNDQWGRLLANLEQGNLSDEKLASRAQEAWNLFQHYSAERFEQAITACITDPERRFFPTVGEIQGYLNDTEPQRDTMDEETRHLFRNPDALRKRREENERWWRDEVIPMLEQLGHDDKP